MSPLSSDRKLLKFSTMNLNSPVSASSNVQTPYEFRSRRASESEINTVDFAITENMITSRFQTLFPEARADTVKEFSPTKKNYDKMQSSNLYLSTSNPKLYQSAGNTQSLFPIKQQRNIKNQITSIVFPPTSPYTEPGEGVPEEDVISFDGNSQAMSASLPKLWKDGNKMKSSVNLQKKKSKKKDSSKRCETVL